MRGIAGRPPVVGHVESEQPVRWMVVVEREGAAETEMAVNSRVGRLGALSSLGCFQLGMALTGDLNMTEAYIFPPIALSSSPPPYLTPPRHRPRRPPSR